MIKKHLERTTAIKLRREGKTYSQILRVVPVAKSTLSIWLKEVGIAKSQKQNFSKIKRISALRGGEAKKKQRIEKQNKILEHAKLEVKNISNQELFLIGIILYWAEGSKEKEYHPGSQLQFSNMDSKMIQVFLIWLSRVCKIPKNMITFNIFLHESHRNRVEEVQKYWSSITGFPINNFQTIYWKRNKLSKTNRRNTKERYCGVLKIKVKESSSLVRKIAGWSEGVFEKITSK